MYRGISLSSTVLNQDSEESFTKRINLQINNYLPLYEWTLQVSQFQHRQMQENHVNLIQQPERRKKSYKSFI